MSVVFWYQPVVGSPLVAQCRNPDLANVQRTETEATFKMAMDGTLYSKRRTAQPTVLSWTFEKLTRSKAEELKNFFTTSAGQSIFIVDFEGNRWMGKATTPVFDFDTNETGLKAGSTRPEYTRFKVELEVALVPGSNPEVF